MFFRSGHILESLGNLYIIILVLRAVLSWFPSSSSSQLNGARRVIYALTEPVLAPFRRIVPAVGMIDLSFLVAFIVVEIVVRNVLGRIPI